MSSSTEAKEAKEESGEKTILAAIVAYVGQGTGWRAKIDRIRDLLNALDQNLAQVHGYSIDENEVEDLIDAQSSSEAEDENNSSETEDEEKSSEAGNKKILSEAEDEKISQGKKTESKTKDDVPSTPSKGKHTPSKSQMKSLVTTPYLSPVKGGPTLRQVLEKVVQDKAVVATWPPGARTCEKLMIDTFSERNLLRLREALIAIHEGQGSAGKAGHKTEGTLSKEADLPTGIKKVISLFEGVQRTELMSGFATMFVLEAHRRLWMEYHQLKVNVKAEEGEVFEWLKVLQQRRKYVGKRLDSWLHDLLSEELYGGWKDEKDKERKKALFKSTTDFGRSVYRLVEVFTLGIIGIVPPDSVSCIRALPVRHIKNFGKVLLDISPVVKNVCQSFMLDVVEPIFDGQMPRVITLQKTTNLLSSKVNLVELMSSPNRLASEKIDDDNVLGAQSIPTEPAAKEGSVEELASTPQPVKTAGPIEAQDWDDTVEEEEEIEEAVAKGGDGGGAKKQEKGADKKKDEESLDDDSDDDSDDPTYTTNEAKHGGSTTFDSDSDVEMAD